MEKARRYIEEYARGKRVTAAVSGGEDSMALLTLLLSYARAGELVLSVVHVNHKIRAAADEDAAFVASFCARHDIPCRVETVDIPARCRESGRGIECEAHFARREIFEAIAANEADLVATAHHARDNAETVLLHLFRGCGMRGLSGMGVLSGRLFRPLIATPKEEITRYAAENGIPCVTDETNADTEYDRNYIRHVLSPQIAARFPSWENAVNRTAAFAAAAQEKLQASLSQDAFAAGENFVSVREEFLSPETIFEALRRLGKCTDVYFPAVDRVMRLRDCRPCARADIGDGYVAAREYGVVTFYRPQAEMRACGRVAAVPFAVPEREDVFVPVGRGVTVSRAWPPYVFGNPAALLFDADAVPQDAVWRTRKEGDVFTPFGGGTRKCKEYFIDKKVPVRLRGGVPLLCSGSRVLIVAGWEIAQALRVTEKTKSVLCARANGEEVSPCEE